jgi:cytochrome c2
LEPERAYPAPIADPLTWIPHAVNASAMSQVWLFGAKMGALNDSLLHIGFNKPEIFSVLLNNREAKPQATIVSVTDRFDFPLLNGSVNPKDGQLYVAGFQVIGWGNVKPSLSGMARVRYTGKESPLPIKIVPMDKGVLVRFGTALDEKSACDPANYSLSSWSYQRSHTYGSAQYKADGETGTDALIASSAYLSNDGTAVFIGVPEMSPVMQLRIGWAICSASGLAMEGNAYTTPYVLSEFDPTKDGFAAITVDLTPRAAMPEVKTPVTIAEGRKLSLLLGCIACHSVEDQDLAKIGPKWNGLFSSVRNYRTPDKKNHEGPADKAYLRESILDPGAKVIAGFEKGEIAMPSYAGVVSEEQLESLVLYIESLK